MARKTAPIPKGYRTATPYLIVTNAAVALDFYQDAFVADVLSRVENDEGVIVHAEIKIGNSIIRLADENPAFGILSPASLGGTPVAIHLYLAKAESAWTDALDAGATVVVPMAETYWGEMYGRLVDPFGHVWSLSRRLDASERTLADTEATAAVDGDAAAPHAVNSPEPLDATVGSTIEPATGKDDPVAA